MPVELWVPMLCALAASAVVLAFSRPILTKLGVVDVPNHRSSHSTVTLRGGGIGPLAGFTVGSIVTMVVAPTTVPPMAIVLTAGVAMALIGLTEDLKGLPIAIRAGSQFITGGAVAVAFGAMPISGWLWIPVATLAFAAYVNFANFMDGINGISGLHGFAVGATYAVLGVVVGVPWIQFAGVVVGVSFLAFLPWNLRKPGLFLGDVGSYLLGGAIATVAIGAVAAGVHPVSVLAPLSVYLADTVYTIIQRARRREPILQAHRSHAYQRLADTGMPHLSVSLTVTAFTLVNGILGILTASGTLHWAASLALVLGLSALFLALPDLRGAPLPAKSSLAVDPIPEPTPVQARVGWNPTRWAVIGASGFIGSAMSEWLEAEGLDPVRVSAPRLALEPSSDGSEIARVAKERIECDAVAEQFIGVDVVINAAGLAAPDGASSAQMYGANSLLPAVIVEAAARAGTRRVIHLSSAAVQGNRGVLDESLDVSPFSLYSHSKALGEASALSAAQTHTGEVDVIVVRATSVQGVGRKTTESLRAVARSPISSVAAPGTQPTVVSSVGGLVDYVGTIAKEAGPVDPVLLQPWEGLSVSEVLSLAGGKAPKVLPAWLCRGLVGMGRVASKVLPELAGPVRRVELMWFGQEQKRGSESDTGVEGEIRMVLSGEVLRGD